MANKKTVTASNIADAKTALGSNEVVNVGGGKFSTPQDVATGNTQTFQIGNNPVTSEQYNAYKKGDNTNIPNVLYSNDPSQITRLQQQNFIANQNAQAQAVVQAQQDAQATQVNQEALNTLNDFPATFQDNISLSGNNAPLQNNLYNDKLANTGEGALGQATILGAGLVGAKGGALAGATIPGLGETGIGETGGAVVGFLGGTLTKMTFSKKQDVKNAKQLFSSAKENMGKIITRMNQDPTYTAEQAVYDFNEQVYDIELADNKLKEETSTDFSRLLFGAQEERIKVEKWKENIPSAREALRQAIIRPDKTKSVSYADLTALA